MALNPRKAKSDALEAIAQIKNNMIRMVNVNTKTKRYTNESKWTDSEEFTTFSHKRMNKGRNVTPNCIKLTKREMQEKIQTLEQDS